MAVTKADISSWLERAKAKQATHMIVACDTFDWDDYPIFVTAEQSAAAEVERVKGQPMTKIMEVYNLSLSLDSQLNERRAYHL